MGWGKGIVGIRWGGGRDGLGWDGVREVGRVRDTNQIGARLFNIGCDL